MNPQPLPLRDIHLPPEPSWWPPAPGWWLVATVLLALVAFGAWRALRAWRARRRRMALRAAFDDASTLADPIARVVAVSELLRRAAREADPTAAALTGEDWLRFLDGDDPQRVFSTGGGRPLADAPWRTSLPPEQAAAIVAAARPRYLQLVGAR